MSDKVLYIFTGVLCATISVVYLRKTLQPPDLRVTRRMIRDAELKRYFDEYELEDEPDDDEIVDL